MASIPGRSIGFANYSAEGFVAKGCIGGIAEGFVAAGRVAKGFVAEGFVAEGCVAEGVGSCIASTAATRTRRSSSIQECNFVAEGFDGTVTITTTIAAVGIAKGFNSSRTRTRRSSSIRDCNFVAEGFFAESSSPSRTIASSPRAPTKTRFGEPCQDGNAGSL